MFPRQPRLRPPRFASFQPQARASWPRHASKKTNPWPEPQGAPEAPAVRSWVAPVSRIANFLIVPTILLYAVFYADFGERDHVFMPPRRWLAAQKAAFFSLSPEEQQLVGADTATSEPPKQGSGTHR